MAKPKHATRIEFCGYIIEREGSRYYVLDWDFDGDRVVAGPFKTSAQAMRWVEPRA